MASLQLDYFPENFIFLQGIKYNYARPAGKSSGSQTKEFYRCQFCNALLCVQKDALTCQLLSNHTSKLCDQARNNWKKIRQMKAQNGLCKRLELVETVPKLVTAKAADTTCEMEEEDEDEPSSSCNLNDAIIMSESSDEADFSSIVATIEVTPVTVPKKKETNARKKTAAESSLRPLANSRTNGSTQTTGAGASQAKEDKLPFKYFDDSMSPNQLRSYYMSKKYFSDSD